MLRLLAAVALGLGTSQDVNTAKILEKADALLEEAKSGYEKARSASSVPAYVEASFKLEEARIKYLVLQEIGDAERQKLAGDRLRAVNQLTKLINDGKVAVMNPPAPKPADPAAPANPDPASAPVPVVPAPAPVDVSKRAAIPEVAKQKEAEKLVRDLFKDDYAMKGVAERRALVRKLLGEARKSKEDPPSVWVLYREAEDLAAQAGDVRAAMEAVDRRSEIFDVDLLQLRATALASITRNVKSLDDASALAEAYLAHVDELVRADQYEAADKAAAGAIAQAKKANNADLSASAASRAKEVGEMKSLYLGQKITLAKLAKDGDDPGANLEMGKFLCFVKGSWDLGLRFMVKGSDATLKGFAEKELSFPEAMGERVAIADGWFELGEKEKSPLRKSKLLAHARDIYEMALPSASGLLQSKIEKRLESLRMLPTGAARTGSVVDLLKLIDVSKDVVAGEWTCDGRSLACTRATENARIQVPYVPPDEYDLTMVVERKGAPEALCVGLAKGASQWAVIIDGWSGSVSGISTVDGRPANSNEAAYRERVLTNKPSTFLCQVRKEGLTVTVDGKKVVEFKGGYQRLSNLPTLSMPNPRALYVGSYKSLHTITKLTLTPISGTGNLLR